LFTTTIEFGWNPLPVTFSVSALLPAERLDGDTEIHPGAGLPTVNVIGVEVVPSGFVTMT
jgi:hypothetical protein